MKKSLLALGILGSFLTLYAVGQSTIKETPREVVSSHQPYEDKKCKDCHGKMNSYEWKSDFCLSCHTKKWDEFSKDYKHEPAIEDCTICHNPHKSNLKYLLKEESKTLCLKCHESDIKDNRIHSKLEKNCTECHNPHASEYELLLRKGGHDICLLCHTTIEQEKLKKAPTIKECKSCHEKNSSGSCCGKEE